MNKIRKSAFKALEKWFSSNDWEEIGCVNCNFCEDANHIWINSKNNALESSCIYCVAPNILCGKGNKSLFNVVDRLYDCSDNEDYIRKAIRYMRIGIFYLILFGKLPKRFMKKVKKFILEINRVIDEIDY